jgi:hypothetical protein
MHLSNNLFLNRSLKEDNSIQLSLAVIKEIAKRMENMILHDFENLKYYVLCWQTLFYYVYLSSNWES